MLLQALENDSMIKKSFFPEIRNKLLVDFLTYQCKIFYGSLFVLLAEDLIAEKASWFDGGLALEATRYLPYLQIEQNTKKPDFFPFF